MIVSPNHSRRHEELTRKGDNDETRERDPKRRGKNDAKEGDEADPITDFLLEGLVKFVKILEIGDEYQFRQKCNSICKSAHEQIITNA